MTSRTGISSGPDPVRPGYHPWTPQSRQSLRGRSVCEETTFCRDTQHNEHERQ